MPQIFCNGKLRINEISASGDISYNPSGFEKSEASFAKYFVRAIPIEIVNFVFSKISRLIFFAISIDEPNSNFIPLIFKKPSSIESC